MIPPEHLTKDNQTKIDVKSDICGDIKTIKYQSYSKNYKKYKLYTCSFRFKIYFGQI